MGARVYMCVRVCVRLHVCGRGAVLTADPRSLYRPKKLRFHPKQLYFSARQGELQKVLLMLGRWASAPVLASVLAGLSSRPSSRARPGPPCPLLCSAHTGRPRV